VPFFSVKTKSSAWDTPAKARNAMAETADSLIFLMISILRPHPGRHGLIMILKYVKVVSAAISGGISQFDEVVHPCIESLGS
jgi:hypothetical protein